MSLRSLFISSSEPSPGRAFLTVAWTFVWLIAIDLAINVVFAYPSDPKVVSPGALRLYFDYGRSVEGKFLRETRRDPAATAPITLTGWYDPLKIGEPPEHSGKEIVTVYGMSHAMRLANALNRTSSRFVARTVGAPGATSNWSYGAYLRDRGGGKSKAVVLAFLSSNLFAINTMSSMTWSIDLPNPYTSDRFFVENGGLRVAHPPYSSFEDYASTLANTDAWAKSMFVIKQNDTMFNDFLISKSVFDHSALFRMLRRAYAQRYFRDKRKAALDQNRFEPGSKQVEVARAIVREFAANARKDSVVPVVFIANNFGYSDLLFRALQPALEADNIPYLSSDKIVSPKDPHGYLPDSHFTDEVDDNLAKELEKIIVANESFSSR